MKRRRDGREGRDEWLYGRRPVLEVLRAARREIHEILVPPVLDATAEWEELVARAHERGIDCKPASREQLERFCGGGNHQGVAMRVGPYPYADIEDALDAGRAGGEALYLILDHLEDPQNVGSLLRTADAAGVTAVILPEDRASAVTPAAVRASAGASEHLMVVRTVNIVRALEALKREGVWLTGLDMDGPNARPYTEIDFRGPAGIVVGAEGNGLSRLARETCDFIAQLPMRGGVSSLNAAVAGAIALYEVVRQRGA